MRCYEVKTEDSSEIEVVRYAGSQADARKKREEIIQFVEEAGLSIKKSQISIEEIEVPTQKGPLIDYLNDLSARADLLDDGDN